MYCKDNKHQEKKYRFYFFDAKRIFYPFLSANFSNFAVNISYKLLMLRIKRSHLFLFQTFLPLLLMTVFICLLAVLMQFWWRHVDDHVRKGLRKDVVMALRLNAAVAMGSLAFTVVSLLAALMVR